MNMFGFDPSQFQYGPDGKVVGFAPEPAPATFDTGIASLAPETQPLFGPDGLVDPQENVLDATGNTSTELYEERDTDDLFNEDGTAGTLNARDLHPLSKEIKDGLDIYDMTDQQKLTLYDTVAYGVSNPGIGSLSGLGYQRPHNNAASVLPINVENPDPISTPPPRPEPPPSVVVDPVDPVDPFENPEPAPVVEPVAPPAFVAIPPTPPPLPVAVVPGDGMAIDPVKPVVVPGDGTAIDAVKPVVVADTTTAPDPDPDPFANTVSDPVSDPVFDPVPFQEVPTMGLDGVMYGSKAAADAADVIYLDAQLEKRKSRLDLAMNSDFGMSIRANTGRGLAGNEVIAPEFGDLASQTDSGKYNPYTRDDRISPTFGELPTGGGDGRSYGATGLTALESNVFNPYSAPRSYGQTEYKVDERDPFANPFLRGIGSIQRAGGG